VSALPLSGTWPAMTDPELELYSTLGCHLCEQAEALLQAVVPHSNRPWRCYVVDIADDDDLLARYGVRIPVLRRCDDDSELQWPFDAAQLQAFLDAAPRV
jgi:hypothetical protein